jgi:predicted transcriptional regulator
MRLFRLRRGGRSSVLGPLEAELMEAVWRAGAPVSVGDVREGLEGGRRLLAYSTIKAVLTNLTEKGHLRRHLVGRGHAYVAVQPRHVFQQRVVTDVVDSLMRDYREPLLVHLADELLDDRDMLRELERLIAEKKRTRREVG